MHYFRHGRTGDFILQSPLILGHEIAGEIVEIAGARAGVCPSGIGLAVEFPSRWCGHCARCREGRPNLCENIYFMGSASKKPSYARRLRHLTSTPALAMREGFTEARPLSAAALAEPLAVCLHAVGRAGAVAGRRGIVFGAGPIGLDVARGATRRNVGNRRCRRSCRPSCVRAAPWRRSRH